MDLYRLLQRCRFVFEMVKLVVEEGCWIKLIWIYIRQDRYKIVIKNDSFNMLWLYDVVD